MESLKLRHYIHTYKHIIIYGVSMIIADSMPVACVYDVMRFSIT